MRATDTLPGKPASAWLDIPRRPDRPALGAERRADVAVIGGGIVGMTTAALLSREGVDVVLLEAGLIGQGVSGRTTAKLSSLQGLTYASLESSHSAETAQVYAEANEAGIGIVARLVAEHGIDCDFRRKVNFTYTEDPEMREQVESEVAAAQRAGLPAELTEQTDLPFEIEAAAQLPEQAEFHPVRYLLGLADVIDADQTHVHERTRVVSVDGGTVRTEDGQRVNADTVVLATHLPILDRGGHFALVEPERSYCLGLRIDGVVPQGMYLSAESPTRSLRSQPLGGDELLIVGGQGHRMGSGDAAKSFLELARFARERFEVRDFEYRWSAHDYMPADGLPLIGPLWPFGGRSVFATGFRKWGMAMGAAAARILADGYLGRENPWADTFHPKRLPPPGSLKELAKHNAQSGVHFFADRLKRDGAEPELASGEGAVVDSGLGKAALYRDDAGRLHRMSARCTHMGCIVEWNGAERSWDCPCHGSRFAATGEVVDGPAIKPLAPKK